MAVQEKRYTSEEFHAFIGRPENRDRLFELIDGVIIQKMASFTPSQIAMRIGRYLGIFVDEHNLGYVTGADGTYILAPGFELIPDAAFISKVRLPVIPEREVEGPPDLAVEVKSPTDSKRELRRKAEDYLRFGTKMVWLVFPDEQRIEVYVQDQDVLDVEIDGVLDGGNVLPGFTLLVRKIFPD
ncbi:MAG: Uma2 family endonuclease [Anaerolineae bacterium]|nr:Uma2 family endonuclease [Anaerolineae bacterium]